MAQILVIDDDPAMRETLCRLLSREGHHAVEATNGRTGLARLKEQSVDLVITDILMPEQEGLETIMRLRREFPDIRIIAISGGGGLEFFNTLSYAEKFGAACTLAKPFTPAELIEVVQRALRREGHASGRSSPDSVALEEQ